MQRRRSKQRDWKSESVPYGGDCPDDSGLLLHRFMVLVLESELQRWAVLPADERPYTLQMWSRVSRAWTLRHIRGDGGGLY